MWGRFRREINLWGVWEIGFVTPAWRDPFVGNRRRLRPGSGRASAAQPGSSRRRGFPDWQWWLPNQWRREVPFAPQAVRRRRWHIPVGTGWEVAQQSGGCVEISLRPGADKLAERL
jgi:hypothetical protein